MIKFSEKENKDNPKKVFRGLEIEGIIPHGLGGDTFIKDISKRIVEGRFWCVNYSNIAIVAVITYSIRETPIDWAAYIGALPSEGYSEEDTIEFAFKYGAKLSENDARHFFPNSFRNIPFGDISYRD